MADKPVHDCPAENEDETPEEITVYAFPMESLIPVFDDGEPWEHYGEHFSFTKPEPVALLAWPCGLITDPRDPYDVAGHTPAEVRAAKADREELIVARKLGAAYRRMVRARESGVESRMASSAYAANLAEDGFAAFYAAHPELLEGEQ